MMTETRNRSHWTRSLRFRLTLWYTGVLAALLLLASVLLYSGVSHTLKAETDAFLTSQARSIAAADPAEADDLAEAITEKPGSARSILNGPLLFDVVYTRLVSRTTNHSVAISPNLTVQPALLAALDPVISLSTAKKGQFSFAGPDEERQMRVLTTPVHLGKVEGWLQVAVPWDHNSDVLERLAALLFLGVPAIILLAGFGGWVLVGRTLQPIGRIVAEAERLDANALPEALLPLAAESDTEIGHLVITLNRMTTRLRRAFEVQRQFAESQQRFAADASHELRTPLTILRGEMELALSRPREAVVYQATLASAVEEIDRMSRIVAGLGFLAREDAGEMSPAPPVQFVDMQQLCTFVGEELAAQAASREISLKIVATAPIFVAGDPDQLHLLLRNLGDNALKYTAPGGSVTLTLAPAAGLGMSASAVITVTDTGIGIAGEDLPFVFDRFWRADRARSSEGSGLGLAISKRIAEAHGGTLTVESTLGSGTTFTLGLPSTNSPRRKLPEAQK
jgi:signal transduction histidine kinase